MSPIVIRLLIYATLAKPHTGGISIHKRNRGLLMLQEKVQGPDAE
jgi:hypothetical protein